MLVLALVAVVAAHDWSAATVQVVDDEGRGLAEVALTMVNEERESSLGVTDALGWSALMILPPHSSIIAYREGYVEKTVVLEGGRERVRVALKEEKK